MQADSTLNIIHFNDVYNIEAEPGVVDFEAQLRKIKAQYPGALVLFSGDLFSPSTLSRMYEGQQMVYCINKLGVHAATFGNHEFDFSSQQTQKLTSQCQFYWLLGNITYKNDPTRFLGDGLDYVVLEASGKKVGVFGVVGEDWMGILSGEYEDALNFEDVNTFSARMAKTLREDEKCDVVIALGHLLQRQDEDLAKNVEGVDLVLGGHDHMILNEMINQIPVVKSGYDFANLGVIQVYQKNSNGNAKYKGRRFDFDVTIKDIPKAKEEDVDKELQAYVLEKKKSYEDTDYTVGGTEVVLDQSEMVIRMQESTYGNFVSDLARLWYGVDCCTLNSGSFRAGKPLEPYQINFLYVTALFDGPILVLEVSGKTMKEVLERSCAERPNPSGCFLFVSGIQYHYDYTKPVGSRVQYAAIQGTPVDDAKIYKLAATEYMQGGGDGYDMLKDAKVLIDAEHGIYIADLILKFFKAEALKLRKAPSVIAKMMNLKPENKGYIEIPPRMCFFRELGEKAKRMKQLVKKVIYANDRLYLLIGPTIEGRIICLNDK